MREFGTWSAAVLAAGYEPYWIPIGRDPAVCLEIRRRYESGEKATDLAAEYGCTTNTIYRRIRRAA
jgi:Mor family transcriptional regulator